MDFRSSAARACMRAGISSEKSSSRRSGIGSFRFPGTAPALPSPLWGGVGGGGGCEHVRNRLEHTVDIRQHFVVPEAHDTIALSFEKLRSLSIRYGLLRVLSAIDLNHKLRMVAREIDDVA